jgi:hypothetical protein
MYKSNPKYSYKSNFTLGKEKVWEQNDQFLSCQSVDLYSSDVEKRIRTCIKSVMDRTRQYSNFSCKSRIRESEMVDAV